MINVGNRFTYINECVGLNPKVYKIKIKFKKEKIRKRK